MSATTTPTKTGGRARATSNASTASPSASSAAVNDDIIPLLLAANNIVVVNYKRIAALDAQQRTASSFEHKFRKWKARAKEISEGVASTASTAGEPNPNDGNGNVPATKRKTANDAVHNGSDDEESPIKKSKVTKEAPGKANGGTEMTAENGTASKVPTNDVALDDEKPVVARRTSARKAPVKVKAPVFGDETGIKEEGETSENEWQPPQTKKRDDGANSLTNVSPTKKAKVAKKGIAKIKEEGETSDNEWQPPQTKKRDDGANSLTNVSPTKKAKVVKKGIARIVKKKLGIRGAGGESDGEEYDGEGEEVKVDVLKTKAKAKGGKAVGGAKPTAKSVGKGKSKATAKGVIENEEAEVDNEEAVTEHEEAEMHFEHIKG